MERRDRPLTRGHGSISLMGRSMPNENQAIDSFLSQIKDAKLAAEDEQTTVSFTRAFNCS